MIVQRKMIFDKNVYNRMKQQEYGRNHFVKNNSSWVPWRAAFSQKCELAHFSCNWALILKARGYFILYFTHTQYGFSSFYLTLTTFEYTASIVSTNIGIVNWWYSLQHDLIQFMQEKTLSINQETIIINSNLKIAFRNAMIEKVIV